MPEAAEVETLRRQLLAHLPLRIESVDVRGHRSVRAHPPAKLDALIGATINGVVRRGKWLGLVGDPIGMRVHLRMSGRLHLVAPECELTRHDHVVLGVVGAGGTRSLRFFDPRTFGEVALWGEEALGAPVPDVLDLGELERAADEVRTSRTVKAVLLDQACFVQGLGNIYADEVCHACSIDPAAAWNGLTPEQRRSLAAAIPGIIQEAASHRGTALADEGWLDLYSEIGGHGPHLRVHARETCADCRGQVTRGKVAGRSTYWCRRCLGVTS